MRSWNPFTTALGGIGVDISGPVIRLAQLSRVAGQVKLAALGEAELSVLADTDPFADESKITKAVLGVLSKPLFGKFTSRLAMASLPEQRCFVRVIHVQSMSDAEIDQAVPFEAESYIPLPMDQVYLDWQRIPSSDDRIALLLVAAPKDLVNKTIKVLESSGLVPASLEVESMSLLRGSVNQSGTSLDALIVDVGTNRTDLVVVEQGSMQFSSNIPIAEGALIAAVAQEFGLSKAQGANLVRKAGINNTQSYPNLRNVLLPMVKNLAVEIDNVISFHDQHSKRRFTHILLVGRGGALSGLDTALQETLSSKLVITAGNPLSAVGAQSLPDNFNIEQMVRFTVAIGLAARILSL